jgi:hypothetical protein
MHLQCVYTRARVCVFVYVCAYVCVLVCVLRMCVSVFFVCICYVSNPTTALQWGRGSEHKYGGGWRHFATTRPTRDESSLLFGSQVRVQAYKSC